MTDSSRSCCHHRMVRTQRGVGLLGILFVVVVLAVAGVVGMQAAPTYLEYVKIQKAVDKAAREGSDPASIRASFDKTATIDDIKSVAGKDLTFKKVGNDKYQTSFAYDKEIPIFKPVFLLIKYNGETK